MNAQEFVIRSLPHAPCRVLEVGCGAGDLARALEGHGYEVTAIDPEAPEGKIFQKVTLEEFADEEPFEAVVANKVLHHVHDLTGGLEKIRRLLHPGGLLILNEFGWEQMDAKTAFWYVTHIPRSPREPPVSAPDLLARWIAEHEHFHDSVSMRKALDASFALKMFEWVPYVAEGALERPELVAEERELMRAGTINAIGFRYVGARV